MCSKNIACFSIKDKKVVNKCPLTLVSFSLLLLLFLFSSLLLSYLLISSLFSLSFLSRVAEKKPINWNNAALNHQAEALNHQAECLEGQSQAPRTC